MGRWRPHIDSESSTRTALLADGTQVELAIDVTEISDADLQSRIRRLDQVHWNLKTNAEGYSLRMTDFVVGGVVVIAIAAAIGTTGVNQSVLALLSLGGLAEMVIVLYRAARSRKAQQVRVEVCDELMGAKLEAERRNLRFEQLQSTMDCC